MRLVFTTLPDVESATRIARGLVDAGLAACVNVLPACQSHYRWQGESCAEAEVPLIIKTAAYAAVETYLRAHHPYQLPEIVACEVVAGLPDYLRWVADATGAA